MAQPLNLTGTDEHKNIVKEDLVLISNIFEMKMLDCTQVLEQLYRFDALDSASCITRPYSLDLAPSGFLLFLS
jgi:hypothetical protein